MAEGSTPAQHTELLGDRAALDFAHLALGEVRVCSMGALALTNRRNQLIRWPLHDVCTSGRIESHRRLAHDKAQPHRAAAPHVQPRTPRASDSGTARRGTAEDGEQQQRTAVATGTSAELCGRGAGLVRWAGGQRSS